MKSRQLLASQGRHSDPRYRPYLEIFTSVLHTEGRPFGQPNQSRFGISDDAHGTQWNLALSEEDVKAYLGVNLEGLRYDGWPIATLLLSELKNPSLEKLKSRIGGPGSVDIRFSRDAWLIRRRPIIVERYIGGSIINLSDTDRRKWSHMVEEGLACLNSAKSYRGRAQQRVTLVKQNNEHQKRLMYVSPHLTFRCSICLDADFEETLRRKLKEMAPVYDWVKSLAGA